MERTLPMVLAGSGFSPRRQLEFLRRVYNRLAARFMERGNVEASAALAAKAAAVSGALATFDQRVAAGMTESEAADAHNNEQTDL